MKVLKMSLLLVILIAGWVSVVRFCPTSCRMARRLFYGIPRLPELNVKNRLEGNYYWLKAGY